jgi:hypothetical protein
LLLFLNVLIISKDIIIVISGNEPDARKTIRSQTTRNWGLIREFCLLTGFTQEQFAAYLSVIYGTINRWENRQ